MLKSKKIFAFVCVILLICIVGMQMNKNKGFGKFEDAFHMNFPLFTKMILAEDHMGWTGDSYSLYVYELPADAMESFITQKNISSWNNLPLSNDVFIKLSTGVTLYNIHGFVPPNSLQNGYYKMNEILHASYQGEPTVTAHEIGMVDMDYNFVYYFRWAVP